MREPYHLESPDSWVKAGGVVHMTPAEFATVRWHGGADAWRVFRPGVGFYPAGGDTRPVKTPIPEGVLIAARGRLNELNVAINSFSLPVAAARSMIRDQETRIKTAAELEAWLLEVGK